ncbi:hypothetical protein IEQ34_001732 [Dendrobium chrysotoxum]|uniref:Uncharacterized protein n=1 Tax=Dendrobium chrysotoxum TaxID=161865 RepID=A0AAV7H8R2_DENCH|nr:hypothetical protein IEQ34_001732 [Dendrobium chrysotoxum]
MNNSSQDNHRLNLMMSHMAEDVTEVEEEEGVGKEVDMVDMEVMEDMEDMVDMQTIKDIQTTKAMQIIKDI